MFNSANVYCCWREPAWKFKLHSTTPPQSSGDIGPVSIFPTFQNSSTFLLWAFFSLHCGLGVRSEPAEVFDGAQTSGASIYAAHSSVNIPICMFGCPRKATKKWNAAVPKISNSIYGFWPVPSLKAELERCLSTLRRKLSSCLEKRRPGLFISPSCAVSPL